MAALVWVAALKCRLLAAFSVRGQGQGKKFPACWRPEMQGKDSRLQRLREASHPTSGAPFSQASRPHVFPSGCSQSPKALIASLPSSALSTFCDGPGARSHAFLGATRSSARSSCPCNYTLLTPTPARHGRSQSTATECNKLRCSCRGWHQPWAPASESWGHCLEWWPGPHARP